MKRKFIKQKAIFQIFLVITLVFFTANIISRDVRAQTSTGGCCVDAGNGQYCVNVESASQCVSGFQSGVNCDSYSECSNLGCCNRIQNDGVCSTNVPSVSCESQGGIWSSDPQCGSVSDCIPKCCVIGAEWRMDFNQNCIDYGGMYYPSITSASECAPLVEGVEEGCCKYSENFKYTTRGDCNSLTGEFFEGTFCSNVAGYSEAGYESHKEAKCGPEGSLKVFDVYWYDSAGNLEEVKENCDPDSLQSVTQCGDTDGNGEYTCESLDCADTWDNPVVDNDGGPRKNGESWCEYQSVVGPGADLPGTRHFRHRCERGKEIVESCATDRSEICIQGKIDYGTEQLGFGNCVTNPGIDCFDATDEASCTDKGFCYWYADTYACLPLSPPGNFLEDTAADDCGRGSTSYEGGWYKNCGGNWRCTDNCELYKDDALKSYTTICGLYGDCSAKYNLAGVYSPWGVSRTGDGCESTEPTNIEDDDAPVNCWTYPPEYYFNFNSYKNAGTGLDLGVIDSSKLGNGSFADRLNLASMLYLFTYKDYFDEASNRDISDISTFLNIWEQNWDDILWGIPAFIVIIVLSIIFLILDFFIDFGCPAKDARYVYFGCGVWQVPLGGDNCEKCHMKQSEGGLLPDYKFDNEDGYTCSEHLCKSLGTWCEFKNEGALGYKCIAVDPQDIIPPIITADKSITKYYCNKELPGDTATCNEDSNSGINLITEGGREQGYEIKGEVIDVYEAAINDKEPIAVLGIQTNEVSNCKYDLVDKQYKEMEYDFVAEDFAGIHELKHNLTIPNDRLRLIDSYNDGNYNLYVRCEDYNDNVNEISYVIKFKLAKQPDKSEPIIYTNKIDPLSGSYVKFGDKNISVKVELNEPAQCKWSRNANTDYEIMENRFNCAGASMVNFTNEIPSPDLTPEDLEGDQVMLPVGRMDCTTILTNISKGENRFYFRCNDTSGNVNTQDWPQIGIQRGYVLYGSQGNLTLPQINCIHTLPNGEVKTECGDIYAFNYTLKLKTEGGMDGNAECKYGFNSMPSIKFLTTGGKEHTQLFAPLNGLPEGQHTINVVCEDKAKNSVTKEIINFIKADRISPKLERAYIDGNYLGVETNEKSYCKFTNSIKFDYSKATDMSSSDGLTHKTVADKDYYKVGCKDVFGNSMVPINLYISGTSVSFG